MYHLINEEWRAYFTGVEEYMNCMQTEQRRVIGQSRAYLQKWIAAFGEDAVMKYDAAE